MSDLADFAAGNLSAKERKVLREDAIETLEREGYIVHKPRPPKEARLDLPGVEGKERVRLGVVSCTHLGSKYQQLTALREFCQYAARSKVDYLIHGGDMTDGPVSRHKNPDEVFIHSYDPAVEYAVANLPAVDVPWLVISGNHDDWWSIDGGPAIVKAICSERDDMTYLGASQGYIDLAGTPVEVLHEDKGGAYAYSYRLQKHIESLEAARKPSLCLLANYHKFAALFYRNTLGLQLPAFQSQTSWMARKSLVSEVGGVIVDIGLHPKGIAPAVRFEVVYTFEPRGEDWP